MTIKNADMPAMPVDRCDADAIEAGIQVFSGLTKRETFCLHIGVAETGDAELDAIIRKGNQRSPAVPDGWQLVPVEPTIKMVQAATHKSVGFGTRAAYQAMLAAAPIRTERENAIDAACKAIGGVGEDELLTIERLYDAGMLK